MEHTDKDSAAQWTVADLERDRSWVFDVDSKTRNYLADLAKHAYDQDRALLDYRRDDFDFGPAGPMIARAMEEALHGRGLAVVRGLPRQGLSEKEFELLNWAIGLHAGVARPQGRATQYISQVRNIGTDYRSASGRGFSSDAKLDFHADGADLATLGCCLRQVIPTRL